MSIPPLVCSTPPPPDQCDDDKDHEEDFDLSYRLSQDGDDDDSYDYGSFSSYSNFQTPENRPCDKKEQNVPKPIENEIKNETEYDNCQNTEQYVVNYDVLETNETQDTKVKCEEDINIEDLNLEVNEEIVTNTEVDIENSEIQGPNVDDLKESQVPDDGSATQHGFNSDSLCYDENVIDNLDINKDTGTDLDKVIDKQFIDTDAVDANVHSENIITLENTSIVSPIEFEEPVEPLKLEELSKALAQEPPKTYENPPEENAINDDFGDFDNFQFAGPENEITNVTKCDNPWESNVINQSDFGSFTANFEDSQSQVTVHSTPETKQEHSSNSSDNPTQQADNDLEDDDFGDFDDFKSSIGAEANETIIEHSTPCQDVPVLNLQSTENEQQIMESISKVLTSIFLEEITEPDSQFEGKLETLLSVTWGHLMETDERQPYIVNWNNSLGQKTLLKALCIDSRNILFGPKWNASMPKYAANLSVAPLQPQKPLSTSNASQNEINTDKTSSKPTTWSDPFTSDGQEFTYAEALLLDLEHLMATLDQMAHNHSTLKISELLSHACNTESDIPGTTGPSDLDVVEGAISKKSEKIYSSTLSVQPLRQINLPDTHIFTPTDSETPRSKTIHYDSSPTVPLPQSIMSDNKKQTERMCNHNSEIVGSCNEDDSEYWEFQDFKSTSQSRIVNEHEAPSLESNYVATSSEIAFTKPSVVFQTQPLQPIKVEPTMPTLNWPEPGEVKEAFDDFSDFVSISSQNTEKQDSAASDTLYQIETSKRGLPGSFNDLNEKSEGVSKDASKNDFDDDFDTFQSALPSKPTTSEFNINSLGNSTSQMSSSYIPDFEHAFPKTNSVKSDTISFPSITRPNEALTENLGHKSNTTENINKNLPSSGIQKNNVLQPSPATFSAVNTQNQQKTAQILQPLSLESYSQINWPSPGIDLQDLSRFNPVETLQSLKSDLSVSGLSAGSSPIHHQKSNVVNKVPDDDVWGEFVSSNPKQPPQAKKPPVFADDDEWTDFISSPSVKPQNGLNTISLNVHTSSNIQKHAMQNKFSMKSNKGPLDIPTLNYITPKSSNAKSYNDRHFQNL